MYKTASSMMSSGTPIASIVGRAVTMPKTIMTTPPATASAMDVWTDLERFSRSFAPKYCEIMTVAPEATPTKKPTSRLMTVPVVPTAANASVPTN